MVPAGALDAAWEAIRRAKRLVWLTALVDLLVCLPAALFVGVTIHKSAAHRSDATEIARSLDLDFMADMRGGDPDFDSVLSVLVIGSLLLFFVVRPLFMGGFVGIAARGDRIRWDEFVREGGAVYWKFLRLSVIGGIAAYVLALAASPLLEYIDGQAEDFAAEGPALRYRLITEAVVFAAYWVMGTILDYTRVGVRMYRRPGVFAELLRSAIFVLQRPLDTLGFSAVAFGLEVGVIWCFAHVLRAADGAYVITSLIVLLLIQILVAMREATRLFHLSGAWHIRRREEGDAVDAEGRGRGGGDDDLLSNLPWNA